MSLGHSGEYLVLSSPVAPFYQVAYKQDAPHLHVPQQAPSKKVFLRENVRSMN